MRRLGWTMVIGGLLACDDATEEAPPPDAVTPDAAEVADGGADAGSAGLDCAQLCPTFETLCQQAFAIRGDCDDCADIVAGAAGDERVEAYARSVATCEDALAASDCRGMYACLSDNDGLAARGSGVQVALSGTLGGAPVDLTVDDAWASVGVKRMSGEPSDLELVFEHQGTFYVLVLDDAANAGAGTLLAGDHPLEVEFNGQQLTFDTGETELTRFALDGAFELSAQLGAADSGDTLGLEASGDLR